MINKDIYIFGSIYLVAFAIIVGYNLTHPIVNDGVYEFDIFLLNIQEGWQFRDQSITNSCLITTWVPAMISKYTGLDAFITFRVFPAMFYPLMPAFTYLIARRYISIKNAVIAGVVVICSSYFLFFPDVGRVGVSLGFMAGMIWALLSGRRWWAVLFGTLTVFSHYGTCLIAIGLVAVVWIITCVWKRQLLTSYMIVFCVLLVSTVVWHFFIAGTSGRYILLQASTITDVPPHSLFALQGIDGSAFFSLESREPVVQEAFGLRISSMTIPEIIELALNWVVVCLITLGVLVVGRTKGIDIQFKTMLITLYALILVTIAVPWLSVYYGAQRVYFTATIVLAVCFPIGVDWISSKLRLIPSLSKAAVLVPYGLATSGLIYWAFDSVKTFPVYWAVEGS